MDRHDLDDFLTTQHPVQPTEYGRAGKDAILRRRGLVRLTETDSLVKAHLDAARAGHYQSINDMLVGMIIALQKRCEELAKATKTEQ